jgi:hypothetical protein
MYKYFGTFSDFVPPSGMDEHSPSVATWLHSMTAEDGMELGSAVSQDRRITDNAR